MKRHVFSLAKAVLLLLCGATALLWVRSYWQPMAMGIPTAQSCRLVCDRGRLWIDDEPTVIEARRIDQMLISTNRKFVQWRMGIRGKALSQARARGLSPQSALDEFNRPQRIEQKVMQGLERETPNITIHRMPTIGLLALILAGPLGIWFLRGERNRIRRERGHCPHCAYNLTGNSSGVCPECGTRVVEKATA